MRDSFARILFLFMKKFLRQIIGAQCEQHVVLAIQID
jgi:hypothetical protein